MEVIPITPAKRVKFYEFSHQQRMNAGGFEFLIPPRGFEIVYKEKISGGVKDRQDDTTPRGIILG